MAESEGKHDLRDSEKAALLPRESVISNRPPDTWAICFQRYYCLFIACCMAALQGGIWNTWGPIAPAVQDKQKGYGWSDGDIALLANWGPIAYLIAFLPSAFSLDFKGLRPTMLITMIVLVIGSSIRHIPGTHGITFTILVHFGQILNGLCGCIAMSVGPVVSVRFYPTHQRTIATSIIAISNYIGFALTFVVGPWMVPKDSDDVDRDVRLYLYWQSGITLFVCLCTIIYFPNTPSNAPSLSATSDRTAFWQGFKDLMSRKSFWLIALAYGMMTGTYSGWGAFLAPNLKNFRSVSSPDEAEKVAGDLGFYATIAGAAGGILIGFSTEMLGGRMKLALILLTGGAFLSYVWFALVCLNVFPVREKAMMYASCVIGGFLLNGSIPLFYEIAVENMYPIAEGSTTVLLTVMNNVGGLLFLLAPLVPGIGNVWANWTLAGSCLFALILIIPFRELKVRTSYDLTGTLDIPKIN